MYIGIISKQDISTAIIRTFAGRLSEQQYEQYYDDNDHDT